MRRILPYRLFENPEYVDLPVKHPIFGTTYNKVLTYTDPDAYCFGYVDGLNGKFIVEPNTTHNKLYKDYVRKDFTYPGRFWKNHRVVSIWPPLPPVEEFKKILRDIGEYVGRDPFTWPKDKGWLVEIGDKLFPIEDYYLEKPSYDKFQKLRHGRNFGKNRININKKWKSWQKPGE